MRIEVNQLRKSTIMIKRCFTMKKCFICQSDVLRKIVKPVSLVSLNQSIQLKDAWLWFPWTPNLHTK